MFQFNSGLDMTALNPVGLPVTPEGAQAKRNMEQFMLAFDTNLAPIVGQQVTLTAATEHAVSPRIDLLMARADAGECDLVAKGRLQDEVGLLYLGGGRYQADRRAVPPILDRDLRRLVTATGAALTYTCVPPGAGTRIGIDRDLDGALDGDERAAGSDPADPRSTP